jgi:hypothetical protein
LEFEQEATAATAISAVLLTPDHTFGDEDYLKTAVRFGLKIKRPPSRTARALLFLLSGSTDQGNTYKNLGTLSFTSTQTEAYINFRLLGATMRFMIEPYVTASPGDPVTDAMVIGAHVITSYSLRIAGTGSELSLKD